MSSIRELTSDELDLVSGGDKADTTKSHTAQIGPLTISTAPGYIGIGIYGASVGVNLNEGVVVFNAGHSSLWLG